MIISDFELEQKVEVLNELDKRIDTVKFDFNDRIDKFLAAASLEHLRYGEVMTCIVQTSSFNFRNSLCFRIIGFPRNPKPRRERMRHRIYHRRRSHRRF